MDVVKNTMPKLAAVKDFQAILKSALEDARSAHQLAKARQSAESVRHMRPPEYKVEDHVWVYRRLLTDAYKKERPASMLGARRFAPFCINKLNRKNGVRLDLPSNMRTHKVIQVSHTQPVMYKPTGLQKAVPVRAEKPNLDGNLEELFEVENILSHRRRGRDY